MFFYKQITYSTTWYVSVPDFVDHNPGLRHMASSSFFKGKTQLLYLAIMVEVSRMLGIA